MPPVPPGVPRPEAERHVAVPVHRWFAIEPITKKWLPVSDLASKIVHREIGSDDAPGESRMDRFSDRVSTPLTSTIVEPVEPNGLADFYLFPEVGSIDQMPICCGQNLPRRQTEIPTILGLRTVGVIVIGYQ